MSSIPRLFLCHYSGFASEIGALAEELRLRGVPPWVDKDGGFGFGDNSQTEARRVISHADETFGLLLYATAGILDRPFIRNVEISEAVTRKDDGPSYLLTMVTRSTKEHPFSRTKFAQESQKHFGIDLNKYHGGSIDYLDAEGINALPLRPQLQHIAREVLKKRLPRLLQADSPVVGINFCTRDVLPSSPDDALHIDATATVRDGGEEAWKRVLLGLRHIKEEVRTIQARPAIRVRGSKHLTAAFLIGRMFSPSTVSELLIQQGDALWSSQSDIGKTPLVVDLENESVNNHHLFVEVGVTHNLRASVRRFTQESGVAPMAHLRFEKGGAESVQLDAQTACAIAQQVRDELRALSSKRRVEKIHLFAAVPQGLMMLIGHSLNATVPIQLYEFDGENYYSSVGVINSDFA